jgi:hypothetical protein
MPWLFHLFLAAHVGAGIAALSSFWGAILTRKGGPAHRAWGRVFTTGIYAASGMALGMGGLSLVWPLAMHPQLTDEPLYRGLFGWMMVYLALLTISMTRYGLMVIANKRRHDANRGWPMVALQLLVLGFAINCAGQGVWLGQPLMIFVALLGFGTTLTYLRFMFRPAHTARPWLPEHLKAMVATGISAYTAFLSVGLIELFPAHAFNPAIWAIPGTVGMMLILYFLRRLPGRARQASTTAIAG